MQDNLRNTSRGSNIKPSISLEVKFKIVTPISSMIVFVNNKQQEAIRLAEIVAVLNKPKVEDGKEHCPEIKNGEVKALITADLYIEGLDIKDLMFAYF